MPCARRALLRTYSHAPGRADLRPPVSLALCRASPPHPALHPLPQVLPIAGNACEHITAVVVALKDKMDLSLGVAVGSSIQIAIFVLPVVVVVGWASGHAFSLDFDAFAVMALTISVIHANFATSDARSHWLIGVALMSNYLLIALVYVYK